MEFIEQIQPNPPEPSELSLLRVRSRRQAMDWSLVLASQGIEAVIDHQPGTGWCLLVKPEESTRSLGAIRQYRLENRRWAWRQELAWPHTTFHWGALIWCLGLILVFWATEALPGRLEALGAMRHDVAATGEWWRLIAAEVLHADAAHLAANVSSGFVLLGLAMGRFGPGKALLGAFVAGAAGNLAGLWLHPAPYTGLGASGVVMGALGLLAAQLAGMLRYGRQAVRSVAGGFVGGFLLFVLLGLNPASDVVAHAGGFGAGALIGVGLALLPERVSMSTRLDGVCGALAILLVAACWALAIGLSSPSAAAASAPVDHRGSRFFGWTAFDGWQRSSYVSENAVVLTSPVIDAGMEWDELVVSWNTVAGPPFGLTAEARGVHAGRSTRFYTLGVLDPNWPGTGNWSFNMAYAGAFPGMRAYAARLTDVAELELWIASGAPVVASVCYHLLRGRVSAERSGHLIVVVGLDAAGDIVANDPGSSERMRATFRRDDFVKAWATSRNTVYLIHPVHHAPPADRYGHWYVGG